MRDLKVGVIGGGSSYNPELIEGFILRREELNIRQVILMDVDPKRLEVVGGLARRMVEKAGLPMKVALTTDYDDAVDGADFVVTQFRVAGMEGRLRDETIPLEFGVIGQETTGPGGFAFALRSIPLVLEICQRLERSASQAWLFNFANPAGLLTEAINKYANVKIAGLCNGPITVQHRLADLLHVEWENIRMDYFGLNHLAWVRHVNHRGEDVTATVLDQILDPEIGTRVMGYPFNSAVLKALRMIPSGYLQFFYHRDRVLQKLTAGPPRARVVMDLDHNLLEMYRDPELKEKPALLEKRGGAWYSWLAVALMSAIVNDKNEIHIVNVTNRGAIAELSPQSVVEVPCVVGRAGITPLTIGEMPVSVRGLVQQVKAYEELTIQAAVERSYDAALLALLNHPLVPSADVAEHLLQRLIEANKGYWPELG